MSRKNSDAIARFVRASMKGWRWAERNQEGAVKIVLQVVDDSEGNEEYQWFMMHEIAKLTAGSSGALDIVDYERTAKIMLDSGTLAKLPQGAWTSYVTNKARIYEKGKLGLMAEKVTNGIKGFFLDL